MVCEYCGKQNADNIDICTGCGAPLPQPVQQPVQQQKQNFKVGCLSLICILIIIIVTVMLIVNHSKKDSLSVANYDTPVSQVVQTKPEHTSGAGAEDDTVSVTIGQKNALLAAEEYLNTMAFSHDDLVEQLEYEGYSHEDAVYGADNCGADWNEQAAISAKDYLDTMAFSRDGLIEQLEYDGFTHEQAVYGTEANGY